MKGQHLLGPAALPLPMRVLAEGAEAGSRQAGDVAEFLPFWALGHSSRLTDLYLKLVFFWGESVE